MFDFKTYAHDASVRAMEAAQLRAALLRSVSPDVRERAIYCECMITAAADCLIALATERVNHVS